MNDLPRLNGPEFGPADGGEISQLVILATASAPTVMT